MYQRYNDTTLDSSPRNAACDVHLASMQTLTQLLRPKLSVLPYGSSRDNSRDIYSMNNLFLAIFTGLRLLIYTLPTYQHLLTEDLLVTFKATG